MQELAYIFPNHQEAGTEGNCLQWTTNNLGRRRFRESRKTCRELSVNHKNGNCKLLALLNTELFLFMWNVTRWVTLLGYGAAKNIFKRACSRSHGLGGFPPLFFFPFSFFGACLCYMLTFLKLRIHIWGIAHVAILWLTRTVKMSTLGIQNK